jgi:hypothetical protein
VAEVVEELRHPRFHYFHPRSFLLRGTGGVDLRHEHDDSPLPTDVPLEPGPPGPSG